MDNGSIAHYHYSDQIFCGSLWCYIIAVYLYAVTPLPFTEASWVLVKKALCSFLFGIPYYSKQCDIYWEKCKANDHLAFRFDFVIRSCSLVPLACLLNTIIDQTTS